jgi:hypothetical protein
VQDGKQPIAGFELSILSHCCPVNFQINAI